MKLIPILISLLLLISCSKEKLTIGIQPYDFFEKSMIDTITQTLHETYNARIIVLPKNDLPKSAFIDIKSPRYRADSILIDLKENKPDSVDFVIGLTKKDISTSKRDKNGKIKKPESKYSDWGVFGLGYKPGPSCVVSSFRLNDNKLFISRLKKVCIHELGHNFGLNHCQTDKCVMKDAAETIKTIDSVNFNLCDKCRRRIQ